MVSVLFGSLSDLNPLESSEAVRELLKLASVFYRYYRIDGITKRTHSRRLRMDLSGRLIGVASHQLGEKNPRGILLLVVEACRLYWPVLFHRQTLRLPVRFIIAVSSGKRAVFSQPK